MIDDQDDREQQGDIMLGWPLRPAGGGLGVRRGKPADRAETWVQAGS